MIIHFPISFRINVNFPKINSNNKVVISESFPNESRLEKMWNLFGQITEELIEELNKELAA